MIRLDVQEAPTEISRYLLHLADGEKILLCQHDVPVAEIRPLPPAKAKPQRRPVGLAKGLFTVPEEFFEPLPEDFLDAFEGKSA